MYTAAFEDRKEMPRYVRYFLENTSRYTRINLMTNASLETRESASRRINIVNLGKLERYEDIVNLFEDIYIHASVNSPKFEKACFLRWLALNLVTKDLTSDDWICMLDTDFILGMTPDNVLAIAKMQSEDDELELIAEWNFQKDIAIGPEITLIKKKTLEKFCQFLVTNFFEKATHLEAKSIYYDRISKGLGGGISDMVALALFMQKEDLKVFNLLDSNAPRLIPNLKLFAHNSNLEGLSRQWVITYQDQELLLAIGDAKIPLVGIHCQGGAKSQMANLVGSYGNHYCDRVLQPQRTLTSEIYLANGGRHGQGKIQQYMFRKINKFLTFKPTSINSLLASL